jgi:hypothetical protein
VRARRSCALGAWANTPENEESGSSHEIEFGVRGRRDEAVAAPVRAFNGEILRAVALTVAVVAGEWLIRPLYRWPRITRLR